MKPTLTEENVYMRRHQDEKVKHFDVSKVTYHKFSHGTVSYTLNGENVNVMLEFALKLGFLPLIRTAPIHMRCKRLTSFRFSSVIQCADRQDSAFCGFLIL